jgi:hypothetical protein
MSLNVNSSNDAIQATHSRSSLSSAHSMTDAGSAQGSRDSLSRPKSSRKVQFKDHGDNNNNTNNDNATIYDSSVPPSLNETSTLQLEAPSSETKGNARTAPSPIHYY